MMIEKYKLEKKTKNRKRKFFLNLSLWSLNFNLTLIMIVLFETLKGLFFFLTILVGLFFLRGYYLLSEENFQLVGSIVMPGYLIFIGVIIGYLIGFFYILSKDDLNKSQKQKIYIKSFLAGLGIGIALALLYVFIS